MWFGVALGNYYANLVFQPFSPWRFGYYINEFLSPEFYLGPITITVGS